MTKNTKELIDESSKLSSSRWCLITCVRWAIVLAIVSIVSFIICTIVGKPLDNGFLGGCGVIIGLIIGIPTAGKATQSFSEYGNNYFDKYEKENTEVHNNIINFEDDGK